MRQCDLLLQYTVFLSCSAAYWPPQSKTNTIDNFIAQKTGVKTYIAENPEHCIARGVDKIINNTGDYSRMMEARRRRKLL